MAYDRAPRPSLIANLPTGPYVAPNSYDVTIESNCGCKGTNWAPFLSCSKRNSNVATSNTPGPDVYYPKLNRKIIGGASVVYTAPRFPKNYASFTPNENDPFHESEEYQEPLPRLKGFMYHCNVPFTLLNYMPSIPKPDHFGYEILDDKTMTECCKIDNDTTLGPAYYFVNFETFATYYRGSFWNKYSKRQQPYKTETPGVGTYNLERLPNQLEDYLNKVRHERRKNACDLRYIDQIQSLALKNNYPAPNQYTIGSVNCSKYKKKIVPKKLIKKRRIILRYNEGPAPNQYTDHRTALNYLVKPSCKKGLNAFLTNAPRFPVRQLEKRPAPNEYCIKSFVEEIAKKISPYAVRNTAFDTSVPKKLYYLPPERSIEIKRKRCKCSEVPAEVEAPIQKPKPVHPFASKTKRFKENLNSYLASPASYNISSSFGFANNSKSFRKVDKHHFLFGEERFCKLTGFFSSEDKNYIPGLKYNLLKFNPNKVNNSGSFGQAKRFTDLKDSCCPGPLSYSLKREPLTHTYNVTLRHTIPLTNFQKYRLALKFGRDNLVSETQPKVKSKRKIKNQTQLLNLEFPQTNTSKFAEQKLNNPDKIF